MARLALGLGASTSDGVAAAYAVQCEGFPVNWLGIGAEVELGGLSELTLFSPGTARTYQALRARMSLRGHVGPHVAVTGALGFGPGVLTKTVYTDVPIPCDSSTTYCDDLDFTPNYVPSSSVNNELSFSLEAGLRAQWRLVEIGGFIRWEHWMKDWDSMSLLTMGPTLGLGF